jgi:arabinosaccharide transport system permease protein
MSKLSKKTTKEKGFSLLLILFFTVLFIIIMLPFYAVTLASFKPGEDLIRYGLNLRFDLNLFIYRRPFLLYLV